jgi:hypothetical protein
MAAVEVSGLGGWIGVILVAISPCAESTRPARIVKREFGSWLVKTLTFLKFFSLKLPKSCERRLYSDKMPRTQGFPRGLTLGDTAAMG